MPAKFDSRSDPISVYSLDGKFLAVASPDGRVTAFDTVPVYKGVHNKSMLADGAPPDGRVTAFDTESGNVVFSLAADGRSTADGKQRVHDVAGQSFEQHTAACWVGHDKTTARPLLVLGTAAGDVKACAADTGKLLWRAGGVCPGGVGAVAWASEAAGLFAAGSSKQLIRLDAKGGKIVSAFDTGRYPLTALSVTPDARSAFVASAAVAAWQPLEQSRLFKFSGHAAAAKSISVLADGMFAVSIAESDRHVALWQCGPKPSKKTRPAAGILSLDHPATAVCMAVDSSSGVSDALFVAALSEAAELYVWKCSPAAEKSGRMQTMLIARITVGNSREERGHDAGILCAQFAGSSVGACRIRVARSTWVRPTFETLTVSVPDGSTAVAATVVLQPLEVLITTP